MNYQYFENHFKDKAYKSGYSEENIIKCLKYAKPLIENNLPVIFNTSNFSALVGYNKNYLKRAALFTPFFYRRFKVKKKNGKYREIKEPLPSLKEIQLWILDNILCNIPVSRFAKAYIKGRSILENVKYHKGKDIVLTLDVENFFPSISIDDIESIFLSVGYSSNVSNLLAKLCCNENILPQGAPTSPALSNIYLKKFDDTISSFCSKNNIRYTRYADDLTFSFSKDKGIIPIIELVESNLRLYKLKLNNDKIKEMTPNSRQVVTGIVVNEKLQLPKEKRKKIRQEIYYISKFGLMDHLKKTENIKANYIEHLMGKINYALHINPHDKEMQRYKELLQSL